jgi:uncharacterized protein (TIGR03086 family)
MSRMDLVKDIQGAATEFGRLVDGTRPVQLDDPTVCATITVRDLFNHVTAGATMFGIAFEQGSVPEEDIPRLMGGDLLGDDYRGAFAAAAEQAGAAFSKPGALDGTVTLPFGELPRDVALGIAVMDVIVHSSDLARATGQDLLLTDEDALIGLELARMHGIDGMRDGETFADIVVIDDDSGAWAELLAYTGRQP